MTRLLAARGDLLPTLSALAAAFLWGLLWLPMRHFEATAGSAFLNFAIFGSLSLILLPFAFVRRRALLPELGWHALTGLGLGAAFATYTNALILTNVVHATVFFYSSPAWSTILGIVILGERLSVARVLAIALGIGGLLTILGYSEGIPLPRNIGDWLAIFSGVAWAVGTFRCSLRPDIRAADLIFGFIFGAFACSVVLFGVLETIGNEAVRPLSPDVWSVRFAAELAALDLIYIWPACFFTVWAARLLTPARLAILLMAEVITAAASAAILTDEPFGLREMAGSMLVIMAGMTELLPRRKAPGAGAEPPAA